MVDPCLFCRLDPAEIGEVRLENELCLFITRPEPILSGSGLIIPRAHRPTVFDLTPTEWLASFELLSSAQALMTRELHPDGFSIGWNVGTAGGQHIFHAHMHVIPRFADEPHAGKGIRYWLRSEENRRPGYPRPTGSQ